MVGQTKLTKEQEERREAARGLVTFMAQYTALLECQLDSIRSDMATAVSEVMDQITHISDKGELKSRMADSVLVKRGKASSDAHKEPALQGDCSEFVTESAAKLAESERSRLQEELAQGGVVLTQNVAAAGTQLRQYMVSLKTLDTRLRSMLFTIMGVLSTDDVVGQRIGHVERALIDLKDGLSEVIKNFDEDFNARMIEGFRQQLEGKVYKAYTMESEKSMFREVFGHEPKKS